MAGFVQWWITHGIQFWMFAQFLFDVVALACILTLNRILRLHQESLTAIARVLFPDGPLMERDR